MPGRTFKEEEVTKDSIMVVVRFPPGSLTKRPEAMEMYKEFEGGILGKQTGERACRVAIDMLEKSIQELNGMIRRGNYNPWKRRKENG